jgi:outer membrane protein
MKNGLLIWNVLLTVVAGYLLITQLGSKKNAGSGSIKSAGGDSAQMRMDFRIAYFEMDSVEAHFEMVKEVKAEITKKEESSNIEMDRAGKNYQSKLAFYQNKQKDMTQAEYEAAAMELKKMEQDLGTLKGRLDQDYSEFAMRKGKEVKTTIEDFLREYNKTRNYAYIVSYEQGLFYYRDSAYNITADVIKGLNEAHKTAKKN